MIIDYWYGDGRTEKQKVAYADCMFYPNDGVYRGNIYNAKREPIGDYSSKNSAEIEKRFLGIFWN